MPPPDGDEELLVIADQPPATVDAKDRKAVKAEARDLDEQRQILELRSLGQDIGERRKYANRSFNLIVSWLAIVLYIVLAQGFGVGLFNYGRFALSDAVLIALITTTTGSIIGIVLIVMRYLFPRR